MGYGAPEHGDDDDDDCEMSHACIGIAMGQLGYDCLDYVSQIVPQCLDANPDDESANCNDELCSNSCKDRFVSAVQALLASDCQLCGIPDGLDQVFAEIFNNYVCGMNKDGEYCYALTKGAFDDVEHVCDADVSSSACDFLEDIGCCFGTFISAYDTLNHAHML